MNDPLIGRRLGQYQITREIGRGGMGVVYEAVHAVIGQRAAVKTLSATLAKEQRNLTRFLSEARACSLIENEGVPRIFDFGQLDSETPYILMEYLKGETLRARLNRRPQGRLELQDAGRITRQIAAAMCAAHEKRILHRDLKPENVILVADSEAPGGERAKILDFGIAHFMAADGEAAGPLSVPLGTPAYMSPEQCLGEAAPDPRTDVYSLGIMFYEMLSGKPPFDGSREELLRRQIFQQAIPLRSRLPEVPMSIGTLLDRMLTKSVKLRPSMAEVHAGLSEPAAITVPPVSSGPQDLPPKPPPVSAHTESMDELAMYRTTPTAARARSQELSPAPSRRRWLRYAAVGIVLIAGLGAALSAAHFRMGSTQEEGQTPRERARWLNARGDTALDAQAYNEAIGFFRQAIDLDPLYGQAYSNLAIAYHKVNRFDEAIGANRKALELATGPRASKLRAASYYNLARIYEANQDFVNALQHYQLAHAERPIYGESIERLKLKQH